MTEDARPATAFDIGRLAELARAAIAELTPTRGGAVWRAREARTEPIETTLSALLDRPDALVLAGTIDTVVLGYAVAHIERLADGTHLGVVDDLFVEEEARGVGVGEAMMGQVVAWCEARDCRGIDTMALPGHRLTKNFFEEFGFTARKLVMHKSLGAGWGPEDGP
ncbi:MAG: GNAT family N-acetyltransferase [Acidimicrobiales bacterium]